MALAIWAGLPWPPSFLIAGEPGNRTGRAASDSPYLIDSVADYQIRIWPVSII
jgi:hypothetical protein